MKQHHRTALPERDVVKTYISQLCVMVLEGHGPHSVRLEANFAREEWSRLSSSFGMFGKANARVG